MSRVIVTDKYKALDLNLPKNAPENSKRSNERPRVFSISRRVRAAIAYTTSLDLYYKKNQEIFSIANKQNDLKSYLKENNKTSSKNRENWMNPRYLNQKIDHLVKLVDANGEKDDKIYTNLDQSLNDRRKNRHNRSVSSINYSLIDNGNSFMKKDFTKDLLLQKRCNQILYSQNYIERLKDRYEKNLQKDKKLQNALATSIQKRWENLLKEKEEKAKQKVGEAQKLLKGDEEEIALMRNTKSELRMKNRLEKFHQKKYMSLWQKCGLPIVGTGYDLKNSFKEKEAVEKERKHSLIIS